MLGYGAYPVGALINDPSLHGEIKTDGDYFGNYAEDYKLAGVIFLYHPNGVDPSDQPLLNKSGLYDIRPEHETLSIPWSDEYRQELIRNGPRGTGTDYALLLVPKGVEMTQFDTLHQAKALGVKVEQVSYGPP